MTADCLTPTFWLWSNIVQVQPDCFTTRIRRLAPQVVMRNLLTKRIDLFNVGESRKWDYAF
jgi:hypothetical protein